MNDYERAAAAIGLCQEMADAKAEAAAGPFADGPVKAVAYRDDPLCKALRVDLSAPRDTAKRAQAVWAGLGGWGPVEHHLVPGLAAEDPETLAEARRFAERDRHNMRQRVIVATLTGLSLTIDDNAAARAA